MADDDDDLLVTISGPALSLLLYENARNPEQYGFLLGEIQVFVTKKVTDSERSVDLIKTHINIKSIIAHRLGCEPFFNTPGYLNEQRLREFLKEDLNKVVGWYHYRYDYKITLNSLRDRNLHTDLSKYFSTLNKIQKPDNFLFCLLNATENETWGTHKFKHLLVRKEGKSYIPVSFKINNLGADAIRPDGSDYKPTPNYTSCQTDCFEKVYHSIRNDLPRVSGLEAVQLIEKSAEAFLAKLIPEVNRTDKLVAELEDQLFELRQQYHKEKVERALLEKQMQQCSMEVDTQPCSPSRMSSSLSTKSEPKTPEFPRMFDSPKISPSSSNIKMATKKSLKQESSEERTRNPTSSERQLNQMKYNTSRSPEIKSNDWESVTERSSESWHQASNPSTSSFENRNVRKSPDYNTKS